VRLTRRSASDIEETSKAGDERAPILDSTSILGGEERLPRHDSTQGMVDMHHVDTQDP